MKSIIHDITKGRHSGELLTVIPIVGPGGIGKTTLAQHIYHTREVQEHFQVKVWACVSLKFQVNALIENIEKDIPKVDNEKKGTARDLIEQRLKNQRLLLVLDDIWDCSNKDEWEQLLLPFKKSQLRGNIIIVTTRIPAQAEMVRKNCDSIYLEGLDHNELKELFLDIVFDDFQSREDHTFLLETADKIVGGLSGSPLAAKTVGRLLKTQLDLSHWTRVLESEEWKQKDGENDIMPALKLSYDYLPSHLQMCFSYCALFPQDYNFKREELINFWIGLDILHSSHGENRRVEDIGISHLIELVNYGFLEKKGKKDGSTYYIIHDLLHELARKVSSLECLSIDSYQSQVNSLKIQPSIHHLSINMDDTLDRLTLKNCVEYFNTLDTRLKVEKLRTLMIFGGHRDCFLKVSGDLFRKAKALRVIFLSKASYNVEYLLCNFNPLHLRYLRIENSYPYKVILPNKITRFYHMVVLHAKCYDNIMCLPRYMNRLVKLRHFLVQDVAIHSCMAEVGKLKSIQELRSFWVKKEGQGFELREIGHLTDLCGSLSICNLEKVQVKEEADEAKLWQKSRLHELILEWCDDNQATNDSKLEEDVLERLKPTSNLLKLSIKGHRGTACPLWLGMNLSVKNLESLCLEGVAWKTFPPIGELWLVNEPHRETFLGKIPDKRFQNLRTLELDELAMVKRWDVHAPCQLFPFLEVLIIRDCPELVELSFSHSSNCCQQGEEANVNLFPRLSELKITKCPRLSSFPPVPWTEAPCSIRIEKIGSSCLDYLSCTEFNSEWTLGIVYGDNVLSSEVSNIPKTDSTWTVLVFHNLTRLKKLEIYNCQPLPLRCLQILSSLKILSLSWSSSSYVFPFVETDSHVKCQIPVETLEISRCEASGKELTELLTYFPKLSSLNLSECLNVTGLGVNVKDQQATETPGSSWSSVGMLLLPLQLQHLEVYSEGNRGGIQGLSYLRELTIEDCPEFLSTSSCSFLFPDSLEDDVGTEETVPLSNLTSLTSLSLSGCMDLIGVGLISLLSQGHLTKLSISGTPFLDSEPSQSEMHEQEIPSHPSKLRELEIDDVYKFTAASIRHGLRFSSLATLKIYGNYIVDRFREEQLENILFVNSLENIEFEDCENLQYLPARLQTLPNLKTLQIKNCEAIQILPEYALPSSLQDLSICDCREIRSLPKDCLPSSLQTLLIWNCPAIQTLPEADDLPSSLRELNVYCRSKELKRHCDKLTGIIPIVRVR